MNSMVDRWLLQNLIEPAKVVAEYRGYLRRKDESVSVIVRVLEYLPDSPQTADPRYREQMRYVAEIVSLDGHLLTTGNPHMSPELALDNLDMIRARGEKLTFAANAGT